MEYYSAIKKDRNFAICSNMDVLGGDYANWSRSEKINTVWYHLCVEFKNDAFKNMHVSLTHGVYQIGLR